MELASSLVGFVMPPPFAEVFRCLRSLYSQYSELGRVLAEAKGISASISSLELLLQSLAGRPDLLAKIADQAGSLKAILEDAQAVVHEMQDADKKRHGSWMGWGAFVCLFVSLFLFSVFLFCS